MHISRIKTHLSNCETFFIYDNKVCSIFFTSCMESILQLIDWDKIKDKFDLWYQIDLRQTNKQNSITSRIIE